MSIFFDFDVGSHGRRFRRAVDGDKSDINLLLSDQSEKLFGSIDIGNLIELSTLSICLINEQKDVIGFMALGDFPAIPAVDPAHWESWIRNMYQKFYLSRNTLFIHHMCCKDSAVEYFLEEALVSVFDNDLYLQQILLTVPPGCPKDILLKHPIMKMKVYQYYPRSGDEYDYSNCLYTFARQELCPRLKMRRAVEEDNDDIIAILDKKCPRLKELYGAYYISELIGRHPDSKRVIAVAEMNSWEVKRSYAQYGTVPTSTERVEEMLSLHRLYRNRYRWSSGATLTTFRIEHRERPVGVMCLNTDIDYEKLNACYELRPYHGLMKATPLEKEMAKRANSLLETFGNPIMLGKWSPFQNFLRTDVGKLGKKSHKSGAEKNDPKKSNKVYFGQNATQTSIHEITHSQYHSEDSERVMNDDVLQAAGVTDILEEDPFDYEIVNIDKSLLTIPDVQVYIHAFELLEAVFELMKLYDYCIIKVPCAEKSFALLQHFCFVPTKPNICSKHALYVAHRSAILGKLRVREAELFDIPQIASLLQDVEAKETLWTIENSIHNNGGHKAYVFQSGLAVVGVAILESAERVDSIRARYKLGLYHNHKYHQSGHDVAAGFSKVKVLLVYSVFEVHYRYFARELMRLSGTSALLWMTAYRNKYVLQKANSIASVMIPLLPRQSNIDYSIAPELRKLTESTRNLTFSTWLIGRRVTSIPKVDVNSRLVVIGASRTAMAFINTLLFSDSSTYLNFTSVMLISPNGLPYTRHANSIAEMMFPQHSTLTDRYLKNVPYTYYVNVIQETIVEIHNEDKYVTLSNRSRCYYDLLFLLLGKQYQHPNYKINYVEKCKEMNHVVTADSKNSSKNCPPYVRLDVPRYLENEQFENRNIPYNVFIVNNLIQAKSALELVENVITQDIYHKIIVYGASIHAYCCLSSLLELKVPTESIVFVEPFPLEDKKKTRVPLFCNYYVDHTIKEVLDSFNIVTYRSYYYQSWCVDECNYVTHVNFLSHFKLLRLECSAFFYYGKRGIDPQAFDAICKSGIVYDGGILIDHEFRTKDPSVYAAGPATRYCRRYYADTFRQKYYDSSEVGVKLAKEVKNHLDPLFTSAIKRKAQSPNNILSDVDRSIPVARHISINEPSPVFNNNNEAIQDLPVLKKPITIHCAMPGGLQYLEVRSPGLKIPNLYVQTLEYNGYVMETFKGGYFKIHFNNEHVVDGITCLTPERRSLEHFKALYGLSTVVLNNSHLRFTTMRLDNLYEFFSLPWAFFLYHEQCEELFAMAKELKPKGKRHGDTLGESLRAVGEQLSDPSFRFDTKMKMKSKFEHSPHVEAIMDYVLEWLTENDLTMPMYLRPGLLPNYTCGLARHPAFKKKKTELANLFHTLC